MKVLSHITQRKQHIIIKRDTLKVIQSTLNVMIQNNSTLVQEQVNRHLIEWKQGEIERLISIRDSVLYAQEEMSFIRKNATTGLTARQKRKIASTENANYNASDQLSIQLPRKKIPENNNNVNNDQGGLEGAQPLPSIQAGSIILIDYNAFYKDKSTGVRQQRGWFTPSEVKLLIRGLFQVKHDDVENVTEYHKAFEYMNLSETELTQIRGRFLPTKTSEQITIELRRSYSTILRMIDFEINIKLEALGLQSKKEKYRFTKEELKILEKGLSEFGSSLTPYKLIQQKYFPQYTVSHLKYYARAIVGRNRQKNPNL